MTRARKLLWIQIVTLASSSVLWVVATFTGWIHSVEFIGHISMAAIVLTPLAGIAGGDAAVEAEAIDDESAAP